MSDDGPIGFVVNPHAGARKSKLWKREISAVMQRAGREFEIIETGSVDAVGTSVHSLRTRVPTVVAVGGDGTVHHVAQALIGSDIRFGVLPNGSGNDFSRTAGMPPGISAGLELLLQGSRELSYDAIEVIATEADAVSPIRRWSVNTAGVGFDAAVSRMKTKIPLLRGLPLYLVSSLVTLAGYRPVGFSVRAGSYSGEYSGLMVAAGIGGFEGGGFRVFPGAVVDDGMMETCEISESNRVAALPLLVKAINGRHPGSKGVRMATAEQVQIRTTRPVAVHADGEVVSERATCVEFAIRPGVLKVLLPIHPYVV